VKRAKLSGATVDVVGTGGLAVVPVGPERVQYCFGVTGGERGLIAADDVNGMRDADLEDGWPDVAPPIDWPLSAVGAEHH
jgi:hypothetical protein